MIYLGGTEISGSDIYIGTERPAAIYVGTEQIWPTDTEPAPSWDFFDDFERTSIGSAWTGSGGLIAGTAPNRHLKKNTSAGSADYWTVQQFSSDDLTVRATLGPVDDLQQRASVILGSPAQYVYIEFSKSGGQIGDYNGTSWTQRASVPVLSWAAGDVIEVRRRGTTISVLRNGTQIASGSSSIAIGSAYRRVALSVRMAVNLFVNWYGPTFDDVGIRAE